jgi:hypothetical protein
MVPHGRVVTVALAFPDLRALASGESIIAFVPSGSVSAGEMLSLVGSGPRPVAQLAPAYRRWADLPVAGPWSAHVLEVHPCRAFDPSRLAARHVLADAPEDGDVLVVRVSEGEGPVLSDESFAARLGSLRSALR